MTCYKLKVCFVMIIVFLSNQVPLHCGLSVQMRYTELLFLNKYHIKHVILCVIL